MFSVDRKVFSVDRKVFPLTRKCFPLTGKCFPLTNFPNGKQTQESLESCFPENEFRETNMALRKEERKEEREENISLKPHHCSSTDTHNLSRKLSPSYFQHHQVIS
jgi:hypothetical protein